MDPRYEQAVRQAATLAFHLAVIERALEVAEALQEFRFLPESIRQQIALAEQVSPDDLRHARQVLQPRQ